MSRSVLSTCINPKVSRRSGNPKLYALSILDHILVYFGFGFKVDIGFDFKVKNLERTAHSPEILGFRGGDLGAHFHDFCLE